MKKSVRGICLGLVLAMTTSVSVFAAEISKTTVTPDKEAKTATVSVEVSNPASEQYVTILVVKDGISLSSVSENDIAYIDQAKATDGKVEFKLGVDTEKFGEKFTAYVGGTSVASPKSSPLSFASSNNPGDVNGDSVVDLEDYMAVINAWNSKPGDGKYNAAADFNGDGIVDLEDYMVVISNYSK